jgi:aromatic-L-amino-acid/L-tryptophan decarboxylase
MTDGQANRRDHSPSPDDSNAQERAARSSSLDVTEEALAELSSLTTALVSDYFAHVSELPVFPEISAADAAARLNTPLPDEGETIARLIDDCRAVIEMSRHNGHPRFFGYVASPSTPIGAYADLIVSALNANVTSWRSAPSATEVERIVLRWLAALIGYNAAGHGLLTSGGSMANLNALYIAHRTKATTDASRVGLWSNGSAPMTIYASDQIHLSIPKAADLLGLGREQVRLLPADASYRLDVRSLREAIESDQRRGLRPFCIVASAGTVSTGAVDPLFEIARVAAEHSLWFHVDGAYGALAALDETKRTLFKGLEHADSVSLDAHKWLYTPVDCGCLLFRDADNARRAFASSESAEYIKIHEETDEEAYAFWDYGVELSRRFRALKLWLTLRYYGARRISAAISEDINLAQYMAECVEAAEDFELLAPVELSICCFRYLPPDARAPLADADTNKRESANEELNQLNARIMHSVQRSGRAYLSNATLRGQYALRACITNFRTTRADIRQTLDIIRAAAAELLSEKDERRGTNSPPKE